MTLMPKVGAWASGQTPTWDAWNRMVKLTEGVTTVGTYAYDGQTRRVWKESVESGSAVTRRHFYYSDQWQVLEERLGNSAAANRSYVWGMRYADDLIARDSQVFGATRLYAVHDQWNVTATLNTFGAATERYAFSAFGNLQVLAPDFTPRASSISGWETSYGAYRFDRESSLYAVRYRNLNSALGRWLSRDPIEEEDGSLLLGYVRNAPAAGVDIYGLQVDLSSFFSPFPPCEGVVRTSATPPYAEMRTGESNGVHPPPNGCGGSGSGFRPPSSYGHGLVDFTPACNEHDDCYSTCGADKEMCDRALRDALLGACRRGIPNWRIIRADCELQARAFYQAVKRFGGTFYEAAQDDVCEWNPCCPTAASPGDTR